MSIYKNAKLNFAKALLEQHQLKLEEQLEYYEKQHQAEKGRNSMIDFNKAINEIYEDLNQVQKEIHFINRLETNLELDGSEEILQ